MIFGFHLLTCLALLVLQTTVFSLGIPAAFRYDPLIPFVVFLGLSRPLAEGLSAMVLAGVLADGLSAGPFGLFGLVYLAVFLAVRWGARFFRDDNPLLPSAGAAAGVLLAHLMALAVSWPVDLSVLLPRGLTMLGGRLLAAVLTGPIMVALLDGLFAVWLDRISRTRNRNGA
jgi:hypothetical protein